MCEHAQHIEQMRQLVRDLDAQHRREQQAFADGFRTGFRDGVDVGYGQRCHEETLAWQEHKKRYRPYANLPVRTEIPRKSA
ncbi:hypothetical protein [Streptosporangium sp. NPDC002524]|uniref:hypothetical protein n=1 Tax=Streptosporangium sp. NPDC002524 TaxID=3154537 RepID=UPI003326EC54